MLRRSQSGFSQKAGQAATRSTADLVDEACRVVYVYLSLSREWNRAPRSDSRLEHGGLLPETGSASTHVSKFVTNWPMTVPTVHAAARGWRVRRGAGVG